MFLKKRVIDWSSLTLDWRALQIGNISKRKAKRIADKVARFVCFISFLSKAGEADKVSINNFMQMLKKSTFAKIVVEHWQKKSQARKGDWRIVRGAQICLDLMNGRD